MWLYSVVGFGMFSGISLASYLVFKMALSLHALQQLDPGAPKNRVLSSRRDRSRPRVHTAPC